MTRRTLNLGILAHVDAGKTTLSERLLHAAGVIEELGRVDDGTTVTDSLALERRRGITIRSAVAALDIGGVPVNLVDTPGHPDFIAEVDRVLGVLDAAVLVISAVEGVQPQTRVLLRALRRRGIPACSSSTRSIAGAPTSSRSRRSSAASAAVVAMGRVNERAPVTLGGRLGAGRPAVSDSLIEVLAGLDDRLLNAYVEDEIGPDAGVGAPS